VKDSKPDHRHGRQEEKGRRSCVRVVQAGQPEPEDLQE
jgi:hypothetical protein